MFLQTFVYFYGLSIDFEVYSAISNDFSDVSIDFEDYSTISNLWCFWCIYWHWSLFRCFYWLLYTFIVYLLTLKSILMFLLTFVHFSDVYKCIYSLWSQFQWSFYLTFVGFHSISPKGLSLGQEDSVLMVMATFLSQWYVKPQNMTTMCNSINPNPNPGQRHQYAFKTQWMRDWREREQTSSKYIQKSKYTKVNRIFKVSRWLRNIIKDYKSHYK